VTRALQNDCPPVLQGLQDQETGSCCACLSRWPTRKAAPHARRTTLAHVFRAPHVRSADVIKPRLAAIQSAGALPTAPGGIAPNALVVHALVAQRRGPWPALTDVDHASAAHTQDHPDCPVLDAWPGAGAVCAPRLLVAGGAPRARYPSAAARQKYASSAPGTERRGKPSWGPWRRPGPQCLRHTVVAWAAASLRPACWAPAYDPQQRDQGTAHQAAVRACAFPWLRLRSRCGQERTPSEASLSLQALKRRNACLLHNLTN
jgi:hypothetical protein